ncbi:3-carboxy-cis,cis-muconate cycloisomerase [Inquilinus ginsengisoli]|uniref:3-carboxy-cis,cis-muconate cycloisomerase n=1 Tax=Inquilinus ginsengisoli TaxID=363840 RepID=A0ABU1JYG7_9PROT|nr:3-carboxy-cis,cis-muconate cycloisomerase [Inquilinus ginsengisoli]MDR6293322.1 3-carboxy-cis,cis-muconate cycloisomerase [Inquilinus ginsengisoli]
MTVSPFDSALTGPLLSDAETAALFTDRTVLRTMLKVEAALAEAQARCGVIGAGAASAIAAAAGALDPDPAALAARTAEDGVPLPALVATLRQAVAASAGDEAAQAVHWGATSQDIIDTGLVLRLRRAIGILDGRIAALVTALAGLADAHRGTVMPGRTRSQQATPISFGLKVAGWLAPLLRDRDRLRELKPRLLLLSFGGASGTLGALGGDGIAVEAALAEVLDLAVSPMPWHAQRDGIAEFAGWLALVTGTLGKIGRDLILLAQNEVAEVRPGAGGGSSTMPQKSNPVGPEALVALARFNAGMVGQLHHAMLHEHERDGAAWQIEWLALPQMLVATGAALNHAVALSGSLKVDAVRMAAQLEASHGLLLAEAASFALSAHMPRPEAQRLVKAAATRATATGRHLFDLLAETSDVPVDWPALRDPARHLGAADAFIDRVLAAAAG